jgi:hypothetical protein
VVVRVQQIEGLGTALLCSICDRHVRRSGSWLNMLMDPVTAAHSLNATNMWCVTTKYVAIKPDCKGSSVKKGSLAGSPGLQVFSRVERACLNLNRG